MLSRRAWTPKNLRRPARWAATSLARNNPRNRHERTSTGRTKSGLHGTQRVPSREMPPPGTIMWTWGWWHPRPQYPEHRQYGCSGLLPLSPASWCHPADSSQTEARRWGGLRHGSSREATEDSHLDAVAGVCRNHDLAMAAPRQASPPISRFIDRLTTRLTLSTITFGDRALAEAREVVVVQLQLLDLMRECGAVPMDAATRADLIDLTARVIAAVFHEEGRGNDRALAQSQNQTGASGSQGDRLPSAVQRQTSTT